MALPAFPVMTVLAIVRRIYSLKPTKNLFIVRMLVAMIKILPV